MTIRGIKAAPAALSDLCVKYDLLLFVMGLLMFLSVAALFGAYRADAAVKPPECERLITKVEVRVTCILEQPGSFVVVGRSTAGYNLSWAVICNRYTYGSGKMINGPFELAVNSRTAPRAFKAMIQSSKCTVVVAAKARNTSQPHRLLGFIKWIHYALPTPFYV